MNTRSSILLFLLCLLGTVTRLAYGLVYTPWLHNPDELSWELLLLSDGFRYDQLIHYPHEGGSIVVSLVAQLAAWLTDFRPLVVAAVLLDLLVRWFQLHVAHRVFNLNVALIFGAWQVFASPALLPWGTLNSGLHALAGVFPFVLLLLLAQWRTATRYQVLTGALVGLAIWFSYTNLVLVPVYLLFVVRHRSGTWPGLLAMVLVLAAHLMVREVADAGFHLRPLETSSIRGTALALDQASTWKRLLHLFSPLTSAAVASPEPANAFRWLRYAYLAFVVMALGGWVVGWRRERPRAAVAVAALVPLLFLVAYALSPFHAEAHTGNHIVFRHLAYVLPFASLLLLVGLWYLRLRTVLVPLFLLIGMSATALLFRTEPIAPRPLTQQATGWVLGTKLGHDPSRVSAILPDETSRCSALTQGVGWGITASLLQEKMWQDSLVSQPLLDTLAALLAAYPEKYQADLEYGVRMAFSDSVSPTLDSTLLEKLWPTPMEVLPDAAPDSLRHDEDGMNL
ncbi:MAG: hypothetical protein AAGB22_00185 [Bacteroidota bacterium]